MKSAKIIQLDLYRKMRRNSEVNPGNTNEGIPLLSPDRLWVLLDRNIGIAVWLGNEGRRIGEILPGRGGNLLSP